MAPKSQEQRKASLVQPADTFFSSSNTWLWRFLPGLITGFALAKYLRVGAGSKGRRKKANNELEWSGPVPSAKEELRMMLCINMSLGMQKGKIAAQCAHAAVGVITDYKESKPQVFNQWERCGQAKIALKVPTEVELLHLLKAASEQCIPYYLVEDAGRTQIAAGSKTVLALGPWKKSVLDELTGHLKLL
ncbi:hypothetical protein WJX74_007630 [Apatococcus lobatus]|uniref:peptidyl-tRNA hydrolase n=2 Tax=Apatococcus TaxID=904362 RepID=A0AAW1S3C3_9CHLO